LNRQTGERAQRATCFREEEMIARLWHGWTTPENADTYENKLVKIKFEQDFSD